MADFPGLTVWTDAYLADTHPELSLEEHGCYFVMMMMAWRSKDCHLPDDDRLMAKRLGVSEKRWSERLKPTMLRFWTRTDDGLLYQKRLLREWQFVQQKVSKKREAGAAGGRAKALNSQHTALANGSDLPQQPTPTPILTESSLCSDSPPKPPKGGDASLRKQLDREFDEAFWPAYPAKTAKPAAKKAFHRARRTHPLEAIITGLESYKRTKPPDRNWMHAATFLNQERFNDEHGSDQAARDEAPAHGGGGRGQAPSVGNAYRRLFGEQT